MKCVFVGVLISTFLCRPAMEVCGGEGGVEYKYLFPNLIMLWTLFMEYPQD
jgi:hypothetical protein